MIERSDQPPGYGDLSPPTTPTLTRVAIVGTGLIGTSVGLALRAAGVDVLLRDEDPRNLELAAARGAGAVWSAGERPPQHVVVATPASAVGSAMDGLRWLPVTCTFSDVASVKTRPVVDVEARSWLTGRFCGGHPVAGRERSGPAAARADLFVGRPWALTPLPGGARPLAHAAEVAFRCGAVVLRRTTAEHDSAMATLSHVPQLVASALATVADGADLDLSGGGFIDMTRLAASDPGLWRHIVGDNAEPVRAALRRLTEQLEGLLAEDDLGAAAEQLVARGRQVRARMRVRAGRPDLTAIQVSVPDRPGALAAVFAVSAGTNIEDVEIEHGAVGTPGQLTLHVSVSHALRLEADLTADGWTVAIVD